MFLWNLVDLKRIKWEGTDALAPGKHTLVFDFKYDGLGLGTLAFNNMSGLAGGTGTLKVVDTKRMEKTLPIILQWDESFDVGSDTITGMNDADYLPAIPADRPVQQTDDHDRPAAVVVRGHQEVEMVAAAPARSRSTARNVASRKLEHAAHDPAMGREL